MDVYSSRLLHWNTWLNIHWQDRGRAVCTLPWCCTRDHDCSDLAGKPVETTFNALCPQTEEDGRLGFHCKALQRWVPKPEPQLEEKRVSHSDL